MSIVKLSTRPDIFAIKTEVNKLLDDIVTGLRPEKSFAEGTWAPPVDIYETENEIVVHAELPGLDQNDIKLTLQGSQLTIRGEKQSETDTKGRNYHRIERTYGRFVRNFELPVEVDAENVSAKFRDGLLEIILPKLEKSNAKEIEIRVG
ncbi:MAG: Hsp20/alpha crystallin family protein [Gemmatimonadetes bacterium]|nr:MAG: Hsp20/alpha crystallin family protein [Gemmatimonadota bacterium]